MYYNVKINHMKFRLVGIIIIVLIIGFAVWHGFSKSGKEPLPEESIENIINVDNSTTTMQLRSRAFENGGLIPSKYTCDGQNVSPPLSISDVPTNAKSLVLIMDDHDVPRNIRVDGVWDHWIVWNISPAVRTIEEGQRVKGTYGIGSNGQTEYAGPCPPDREHRYEFSLYVLDIELSLRAGAPKIEVLNNMTTHIIAQTKLTGRYERKK